MPDADIDPIRTEDWPARAERPAYSALDSSSFARDWGFTMPRWEDSLPKVVSRIATEPA